MRWALLLLLAVVVIAGYTGTLIARDPGYVLVTYAGYSMQTSFWVLLGLLAVSFLLLYLFFRIIGALTRSGARVKQWRETARENRASQLTLKGMRLLLEGESGRARKFLTGGAENSGSEGLNYLVAARAADGEGDHLARETYLRKAIELDPSLDVAAKVLAAELALVRRDADAALNALQDVRLNDYQASLKLQALQLAGDWRRSMATLPELRKHLDVAAFEREVALAGLSAEAGDDAALNALFKSLSGSLRGDPEIIARYVASLSYKADAEPVLRVAIKNSWNSSLVVAYGDADFDSLKTRRKAAENWLKQHEDDPSLHYCLGRLHELANETSLARQSYERCIDLGGVPGAHARLGVLLAQNGELERSNEQLRLALMS